MLRIHALHRAASGLRTQAIMVTTDYNKVIVFSRYCGLFYIHRVKSIFYNQARSPLSAGPEYASNTATLPDSLP